MEKKICKICIIFIVIIMAFRGSVYAVKYEVPDKETWPEVIRNAFNESYKGKEYDPKKVEDVANNVYKKVFDKIKTYNETKLEKFKESCYEAGNKWYNQPNIGYSKNTPANDICYMIVNKLRADAIPKLSSGKYNKNTKSSDIGKITTTENTKLTEKYYGKDSEIKGDKADNNKTSVGILPERDLGLDVSKKQEAVKENSPDDIIKKADSFLSKGKEDELDNKSLQTTSNMVYNILLGIAIAVAVIIGIVLGISFMVSGAEGQAKIKEALIPYIIGCFVSFGAFGIWKLIITILNQV